MGLLLPQWKRKKVSKCPMKKSTTTEYVIFLSLQLYSNFLVIPYRTVQKTDTVTGFT